MKLKPCPFCGKKEAEVLPSGILEDFFAIHCTYCHVATRMFLGKKKAIRKWNTRKGVK